MYPSGGTAVEEASFLHNRQLLAQIQGNPGIAFDQDVSKAPLPGQTLLRPMSKIVPVVPPGRVPYAGAPFLPGAPPSSMAGPPPQRPAHQHQQAMMQAMLQQQIMSNNTNKVGQPAYLQNNNMAVAAAAAAAVAATQQAAQVRAAQAQARATVASMLQQQAMQQQQQQRINVHNTAIGQNAAMNNAINAAIQRAATSVTAPPGGGLTPQQLNMAAANQIMQQYQTQHQQLLQQQVHEQARRAQLIKQAQNIALAQQQQAAQGQATSIQSMLTQAQLQDALVATANGLQRFPFGQAQQAQAHAHAQQQAQAHMHHQAQLQSQARQNMAALANLTPAQLQALGANPTLTQALLQVRAAQQQQQQQAQAATHPQGMDPALIASLRARQQQQHQALGNFVPTPVDNASPASSNSGSPPNSNNMSKEQRRMALACVALQLARSGLSVDQAIHSGIMGGMSVTDVRFIVEVYNAEVARVKDTSSEGNGPHRSDGRPMASVGEGALRPPRHTAASHNVSLGSPTHSSYAGSDAGNSAPSRSRGGSVVGSTADLMHADSALGEDGTQAPFNAFSYGFFGESGGEAELLGDLETDLGVACAWQQQDACGDNPQDPGMPRKQDDVAERLANLDLGYGFF